MFELNLEQHFVMLILKWSSEAFALFHSAVMNEAKNLTHFRSCQVYGKNQRHFIDINNAWICPGGSVSLWIIWEICFHATTCTNITTRTKKSKHRRGLGPKPQTKFWPVCHDAITVTAQLLHFAEMFTDLECILWFILWEQCGNLKNNNNKNQTFDCYVCRMIICMLYYCTELWRIKAEMLVWYPGLVCETEFMVCVCVSLVLYGMETISPAQLFVTWWMQILNWISFLASFPVTVLNHHEDGYLQIYMLACC